MEKEKGQGILQKVIYTILGLFLVLGAIRGCVSVIDYSEGNHKKWVAEGKIIEVKTFKFDGSKLTVFREGKSSFQFISPSVVEFSPDGLAVYIRPLKSKDSVRLEFAINSSAAMRFRDELRQKADEVGAIPGPAGVVANVFVF